MPITRYQREWPDNTTSLQIELTMYTYCERKKDYSNKLNHLKNAYALLYPDLIPTFNSWTESIMKGFCEETRIGGGSFAILGASGTGKSMTMGYLAVLDWLADIDNTVILCASDTLDNLNDRIWKYIKKAYHSLPFKVGKQVLSKPESLRTLTPGAEGGIYATALDRDPEAEGLKGYHPKRLRIIIDEATAIPPTVLNVWINWTAANKNFGLTTLSNFRGLDNLSAAVTEPLTGWMGVDYETQTTWKTKQGGQALLLDAMRSPVYLNPHLKTKLPFLKTKEEVDAIIYGTKDRPGLGPTHPRVMQYIRSIPTFDEAEKTVLTKKIIVKGGADQKTQWAGFGRTKLLSLDPAFVTDGDSCVLQPGLLGYERDGVQVLEFGEPINIPLDSSSRKPTEYQILDYVVDYALKHKIPPENFILDGGGSGRGLGSIFKYEWSERVTVIYPGQQPTDSIVEYEFSKTAKDIYDRLVTELWFEIRRFTETAQLRNLPPKAQLQFCTRVYNDSKIKIRIETKPEYKLRITGEDSVAGSPDDADACTYLLHLAKLHGLTLASRTRTYETAIPTDYRTKVEEAVMDWVKNRETPHQNPDDSQPFTMYDTDYSGSAIIED